MILKFGVDLFQDRVHELSVGMHMSIIFFEGTVAYHISEILEGDITIKMIRSNILFFFQGRVKMCPAPTNIAELL